jgi:hypothetical protein
MIANENDRHSIMAVYPLESFKLEADQNSMATETSRHGFLIETAPNRDGSFHLVRVTKSIGDPPEGPHALFICPYMGRAYECFVMLGGAEGVVEEKQNHIIDPQLQEYDAFIDAVIAAAQGFTPLGPRTRPHSAEPRRQSRGQTKR